MLWVHKIASWARSVLGEASKVDKSGYYPSFGVRHGASRGKRYYVNARLTLMWSFGVLRAATWAVDAGTRHTYVPG